jgi:hypothetical protein
MTMLTYSVWSGNYVLIIPKQLRELLVAAGWHKQDIGEYIYRSARVLRRDWATVGKANIVHRRGGPNQEFTALRSQHGVANILRFKKPDASRPAPPEVMADMKFCQAMISAVGD